jgi:DNA polymerase/3'-5' exonuclease PolX
MRLKYGEGLIKDSNAIAGETEQGVFDALGLPYPLPYTREMFEGKPIWLLAPK